MEGGIPLYYLRASDSICVCHHWAPMPAHQGKHNYPQMLFYCLVSLINLNHHQYLITKLKHFKGYQAQSIKLPKQQAPPVPYQ